MLSCLESNEEIFLNLFPLFVVMCLKFDYSVVKIIVKQYSFKTDKTVTLIVRVLDFVCVNHELFAMCTLFFQSTRIFSKQLRPSLIFNANKLQSLYNFQSSVIFIYLTNVDYIRYLLEKLTRENKVIAAVKKWKCFQF